MNQVKKATFSLTEETLEQLEKLAKETGFAKSTIIKMLINTAEENKTFLKLTKKE